MTEEKPMTVGELREEMKNLPDHYPIKIRIIDYGEEYEGTLDLVEDFEDKMIICVIGII